MLLIFIHETCVRTWHDNNIIDTFTITYQHLYITIVNIIIINTDINIWSDITVKQTHDDNTVSEGLLSDGTKTIH